MATNPINPVEDEAPKRSALDTFAQAMGILSSLGGAASSGYNAFGPGAEAAKASTDLAKAQLGQLQNKNLGTMYPGFQFQFTKE